MAAEKSFKQWLRLEYTRVEAGKNSSKTEESKAYYQGKIDILNDIFRELERTLG